MDKLDFLNKMLAKGKITQEQHDKVLAKQAVIAEYKNKKDTLLKSEMGAFLDILSS